MPKIVDQIIGSDFRGLALSQNVLTRQIPFTQTFKNIVVDGRERIKKRNGYQLFSQYSTASGRQDAFKGLSSLIHKSQAGALSREILVWVTDPSDNTVKLHRFSETQKITVSYSGAGTARLSFLVVAGQWQLQLTVNNVAVSGWPKNYGTGLASSPTGIATLVSDIDAEANFACTLTGTSTNVPAAALQVTDSLTVTAGGVDIPVGYFTPIQTGVSRTAYTQKFNTSSFTSPNMAVLNKSAYWARDQQGAVSQTDSEIKHIYKYDGLRCYRAGLPRIHPYTSSMGADAGAGIQAGQYNYRIRLKRVDYRGKIIQGNFNDSDQFGNLNLLGPGYTITVTNGGSGFRQTVNVGFKIYGLIDPTAVMTSAEGQDFMFRGATSAGNQTGVTTVNVDSGHTLQIGDEVWILNRDASNALVKRTVTATAATTITLDSSIGVNTNDYISNFTVEVYRTTRGPGPNWYFMAEIPIRTAAFQFDLIDNVLDSQLVERGFLVEPDVLHDLPPAGRFVCSHQGCLIIAGIPGRENSVFVSDSTHPEYVPATNFFDVSHTGRGDVTGIGSDGERLYIFKESSYTIVNGNVRIVDIGEPPDVFVEEKNFGIGCVSHDTIKLGKEGLYFLSFSGPQRLIESVVDEEFASRQESYFLEKFESDAQISLVDPTTVFASKLFFRHATAAYDDIRRYYLLNIPIESGELTDELYSAEAKTLVYEEKKGGGRGDRWFDWGSTNHVVIGGTGGITVIDGKIWTAGQFLVSANTTRSFVSREIVRSDRYRLADNVEAIDGDYHTPWESFGNPSVYKKLPRCRVWRTNEGIVIPGTYTVRAYKDFEDDTSSSNAYSSTTMDFSSALTTRVKKDLKQVVLGAVLLQIQNNTIYEDLVISLIEIAHDLEYEGGDIETR